MAEEKVHKKAQFNFWGFFTNEQGLPHMTHLAAFVALVVGVALAFVSVYGFFVMIDGWIQILQVSAGLIASGSGLEGWETKIERDRIHNRESRTAGSPSSSTEDNSKSDDDDDESNSDTTQNV